MTEKIKCSECGKISKKTDFGEHGRSFMVLMERIETRSSDVVEVKDIFKPICKECMKP